MPAKTRQELGNAITVTVIRMVFYQSSASDLLMEGSLAVRDSVSNCFRGTALASAAAAFVEQHIPPGGPLTLESQRRLLDLAEAVKNGRIQTFNW
ncbi:hypothetical protein [Pseudomonas tohonis]|uniref:hypothetical protein n=1 Tax=Pseudomonas tohonis TaxID=2725477 RepID=UPI0021D8F35A|nr:hypothetical protein [Pseudomonas tohonis]UXY55386.1 hypothetical protein N9L84_12695 [Pseudomonas tohonis]